MLSVRNLTKIYKIKGKDVKEVVALDHVNIDFPERGMIFLLGKSGSGKSTLLNTIGGLDKFDDGEVIIKGKSSRQFKAGDFDAYRNTFIGFIFQEYNILDDFTVGKNLALALELQGKKASRQTVDDLLDKVDLHGYYKRKPNQLSGGQKQRVAIARALIKDPEIIMADEPTGALDSNTGRQVMDTLKKLSKEKLIIVVSHDREFAEIYGDRVIELKDGKVLSDTTKHEIEAEKSLSGVSFIEDKIVHIKKDQRITQQDLRRINELIINNLGKEDTIISFDSKPNAEVKRTAFITDDGNREVFKPTTSEDVDLKQYDPKKFKLIKSKMRIGDEFKMGTSSLKHKPIRLLFTILLSFVAFAMFGITDTMASFNVATSTYESLKNTNTKTISISGTESNSDESYYYSTALTKSSSEKLKSDNSNYKMYDVIFGGGGFNLDTETGYIEYKSNNNNFYSTTLSGIMPIDQEIIEFFNLSSLEGRLPTAKDEIVISRHVFTCLTKNYNNINTLDDISKSTGKYLSIYGNNRYHKFYIVGIINDDTDVSKYSGENSQEMQSLSDYMHYSEMQTIMKYGLLNMCYVSHDSYNELAANYHIDRSLIAYIGDVSTNSYWSGYDDISYKYSQYGETPHYGRYDNPDPNSWYNPSPWDDMSEYYLITYEDYYIYCSKTGFSVNSMSNNDAVVPKDVLSRSNITYETEDELRQILDSGLVLTVEAQNGKKVAEFNVVAVFNDSENRVSLTHDKYDELFLGSDYLITRIKNSNDDKTLVNKIVNYNNNGNGYQIQFQSTATLSNFSNTILSVSKILLYVGIGFAAFASFMLLNFISISINYKKREIGVLRAIGAGKKDVFGIFFSESFVIAIINFVLATIATFVVCFFINRALFENLGFNVTLLTVGLRQIILLLVISVGVAFIATLLPVYKIARKNPIDSINNR